jgi:hypothetical protein
LPKKIEAKVYEFGFLNEEKMEESLKKFILYTAPSGEVRVDVLLQNESVWLAKKGNCRVIWCSKIYHKRAFI